MNTCYADILNSVTQEIQNPTLVSYGVAKIVFLPFFHVGLTSLMCLCVFSPYKVRQA